MKISNKLNRILSIVTAIVFIITMLIHFLYSGISLYMIFERGFYSAFFRQLLILAVGAVSSLLMSAALIRGKKDTIAGVLFTVPLLQILLIGVIGNLRSLVEGFMTVDSWYNETICYMLSCLISVGAGLVGSVFRGLTVLECFKPGKISGNVIKWSYLTLPVVGIVLSALATFANQLYLIGDYGFFHFLLTAGFQVLIGAIISFGFVLLGITFSIPVYEQNQTECENDVTEADDTVSC